MLRSQIDHLGLAGNETLCQLLRRAERDSVTGRLRMVRPLRHGQGCAGPAAGMCNPFLTQIVQQSPPQVVQGGEGDGESPVRSDLHLLHIIGSAAGALQLTANVLLRHCPMEGRGRSGAFQPDLMALAVRRRDAEGPAGLHLHRHGHRHSGVFSVILLPGPGKEFFRHLLFFVDAEHVLSRLALVIAVGKALAVKGGSISSSS